MHHEYYIYIYLLRKQNILWKTLDLVPNYIAYFTRLFPLCVFWFVRTISWKTARHKISVGNSLLLSTYIFIYICYPNILRLVRMIIV